jgi:hypothetical protein
VTVLIHWTQVQNTTFLSSASQTSSSLPLFITTKTRASPSPPLPPFYLSFCFHKGDIQRWLRNKDACLFQTTQLNSTKSYLIFFVSLSLTLTNFLFVSNIFSYFDFFCVGIEFHYSVTISDDYYFILENS